VDSRAIIGLRQELGAILCGCLRGSPLFGREEAAMRLGKGRISRQGGRERRMGRFPLSPPEVHHPQVVMGVGGDVGQ
jgi:hypothetical protein